MARPVGKITITVGQTTHGEHIAIRTTGKRGQVLLNTLKLDSDFNSQSPSPDAHTFWEAVLTRAQGMVVSP